jgi:MarR family transcriptional regulator, organic hydroperoxide resistance regulator
VLKRLEKRGLLERKSDPLDGRKALFALTEAGRTLDVPSSGTVESAVQRVLSRMSRPRIVHTQDVLTALAEELGGIPMGAVAAEPSTAPETDAD